MRIIKKEDSKQLPALGKVGNISIGKKDKNASGKEYPVSLDHFLFRSDYKKHVDDAVAIYGESPNSLDIFFYSDSPGECCSQRLELRDSGGRMVAYGDGETFFRSTKDKGMVEERISDYPNANYMAALAAKHSSEWTEVLIMRFILAKTPNIGYWEFRTKGKDTTIPQILGTFDSILAQFGTVSRIPFSLLVKKHKSNRSEVSRNYPVVSLILNLSPEAMDRVRSIGAGIQGFLTEDKLLSAPPLLDSGFSNYEEIE